MGVFPMQRRLAISERDTPPSRGGIGKNKHRQSASHKDVIDRLQQSVNKM